MIKENDFTRLDNDYYGNPRYYLPTFEISEAAARSAGGVRYRGKKLGTGWVFKGYMISLADLAASLNKFNHDTIKT